MRSKKLAFRRDWKAQITRSACRSSVLKSIHTIHALGCHVFAAPPDHPPPPPTNKPPHIPSLTLIPLSVTAPFFFELPVIKGDILTGSYKRKKNGCIKGYKGKVSQGAMGLLIIDKKRCSIPVSSRRENNLVADLITILKGPVCEI